MKVAMLGQYPVQPSRPDGGVETVVSLLCKEMARRPEVELHVVSCNSAQQGCPSELEAGVIMHSLQRKRLGRASFYRRDVRGLCECLREFQPDVVHAHGTGLYAAAAVSADYPATVITPHGIVAREARLAMPLQERVGWYLQALWEARVLRRGRRIITISPYVEQELAHLTRATFHPIDNPVDDLYFSLPDPQPTGCILWIGRVIPRKDPQTAIRAFAGVKRAFPRARLRIAGETASFPSYARTTRKLVAQLGLTDSVHFLGQLDRKTVIEELQQAQLLLITSVQETAPVVIAEAMACGRPVVATDVGGCGHLISPGKTGFLAPKGDAVALARHIISLLESPDLTVRLSRAARCEAEARFRASLAVDKTLELYRNLLSAKGVACFRKVRSADRILT
jgi:glycosyltransferase involved in cell wall biosynthesis